MPRQLKCPKCGSINFITKRPSLIPEQGHWSGRRLSRHVCANPDCGHVVTVTPVTPDTEHVFIGDNDKVE